MNYQFLIEELKDICIHAGVFIRKNFRKVSFDQVELKSVNSMVSYVDKTAEVMITQRLKQLLPEAGFLTEENTISNSDAENVWIVDPLDGTTNYIRGLPHFSISIALQRNNDIMIGVVFDVMQQEFYYAIKNKGAFRNGQKLCVNKPVSLNEMLIATGFPYNKSLISSKFDTILNYFVHNSRCIRRLGSAALDLCYTASGNFDLYFEMYLSPWDYAAGTLIVTEAGGVIKSLDGEDIIKSGSILATNPENREVIDFLLKTNKQESLQ